MKFTNAIRVPVRTFSLILLLSLALPVTPAQGAQFNLKSLFSFTCDSNGDCPNGDLPNSLIQSEDGNFYGTTELGGPGSQAKGTVFKLTPNGELTTLFTFTNDQNGAEPSNLVEGNDGFLYGLTIFPNNNATGLFKLSKTGQIKIISQIGSNAYNLLLADDGNFYFCTLGANPIPGQVLRVDDRSDRGH